MNHWLWETLSWTDLLDIGLLAFILYRTLLLLWGTRAIQSLVGLLFLVALYLLAGQLGLTSIHWLMDKLLVYVVLAVIVLFQQDIRAALASAGGRFLPRWRRTAELSMIEDIVKSSFSMASRRMGALIALEMEASLSEYVEAGHALDARLSQELLLAIFHPTSPIHDGAVVLRKGRVAAAKVFFPLTESKTVSRFVGSRHRAALGISEETDVIVVVVSEERGTVSVIHGGQITPASEPNELREVLQHLLSGGRADARALGVGA
jgi:diadenylate cyclase